MKRRLLWLRRESRCLLAALGLLAISCEPALAGDAPTWMHAQVGVALPQYDERTDAVLLYSESTLSVGTNGKIRSVERRVYKILRPDGAGYGVVKVHFGDQSPIISLHAWCIPTAGKDFEAKEKDSVDVANDADGAELFQDLRVRLLRIPAATPGSIVGYEVEQQLGPYGLTNEWDFQDTVPVREAHYTLQLPQGWSYKVSWFNHAEQAPIADGSQLHWTVNNLSAIKLEPRMPVWEAFAGRMMVSLIPPSGQYGGMQSWHDVGAWYQDLTRDRRIASPQIKQRVSELTAFTPTKLEKMRALAAFVQNDIRYVAIELGIGGYQPRPAAEIFSHHYGDCKDKVTLLSSALQEIGIESYYVIINTDRGVIGALTPPNLGFNHAILAIRLPDDVQDPSLLALVQHPTLGRVLFFDPTNDMTAFGNLPGYLQQNYGMLVAPTGGELIELPQVLNGSNAIARTGKMTLDADGTLRGEVHEIWSGDVAASQRQRLRSAAAATDQIKPVEAMLGNSLGTVQILKANVANLYVTDRPFGWNYSIEAPNYAKSTGDLLLVRPRVLGTEALGFLETKEPRQHPIEFDSLQHDTDVFEIALPAGYAVDDLPPSVDRDFGFATYHSKTEAVGESIRYTRSFEIKELSVPASKAEDLKRLYRIIGSDERMTAVLKQVTH